MLVSAVRYGPLRLARSRVLDVDVTAQAGVGVSMWFCYVFFFSSRRRHTRCSRDWSSDVCSSDLCVRRVGCQLIQGYGLTEASPVTHTVPDEPGKGRPGTIGQLLPNTECRIVDPATGGDLGPGEAGELLIRGPQVMTGYLNNPEATAETLDAAGWLHTGDIGHVDADGYFTTVDRLKELIKYKGFQVPPAELEAVLRTHPAVSDAAVIPIPDEEAGEVPKAYVVLKGDVPLEALLAYVAERVAPYKRIRAVEVVDAIPRSPSGKILRRLLKERERAVRA